MYTCATASPLRLGGPIADAPELVEPEAGGASVLLGHTLDTGIEYGADAGVGMSVESVEAGAEVVGPLGCLCNINDNERELSLCTILYVQLVTMHMYRKWFIWGP
jgi:hypothetical protein